MVEPSSDLLIVSSALERQCGTGVTEEPFRGGTIVGKKIDCGKVNPAGGCNHVVRGNTEEELLMNAKAHAKEHGIVEVTPELIAMIKAHIEDE
jgi:predicted small metal-binding protein